MACCRLGLTHFESAFLHFKALLSVVAKRETSEVSKASEERICHFPPFYFIKTHLAGTVLFDTRRLMSFEFLFVCGCPLGPCHFILMPPSPNQIGASLLSDITIQITLAPTLKVKYIKALSPSCCWLESR